MAPPLTGDTSNARAATTAEADANAAQDGVQAHVLWGEDPALALTLRLPRAYSIL